MKGKTNSSMKNLFFYLFLFIALLSTAACGNDDNGDDPMDPGPCTSFLYTERITAVFESLNATLLTYANDPSISNCEAYRDAAQEYLDALREFETCTFLANDAEYQESVREAQQEVNDIDC